MAGSSTNSSTSSARITAPVGVVSSPPGPPKTGTPRSSSAVAGAGIATSPCAIFTRPLPRLTGPQVSRAGARCSIAAAAPTRSTIESIAPTSWKWIRSIGMPCAFASASPSRWKSRSARSFTAAGESAPLDQLADLGQTARGAVVMAVAHVG